MRNIINVLTFIQLFIAIHSISDGSSEWCIESKFHKQKPGKESSLYKQCEPWKEHSCCYENTTIKAHEKTNHYKFDFDHCRPMSEECKKHFIQDLCFYECEPNVKPWVVKVERSFAKERIYKVPICSSDCDIWWDKCKDDYTCAKVWPREFKWINGINQCPKEAQCKPFKEIYSGAQQFCEKVWDDSWSYTTQDKPCMKIWFNSASGNPNRATAEWYAMNHSPIPSIDWFYPLLILLLIMF